MAFRLRKLEIVSQAQHDEVLMLSTVHGISPRSLAELALVVSQRGHGAGGPGLLSSPTAIRAVWQSNRQLQQRWSKLLEVGVTNQSPDPDLLERIAPRLFACEMLIRTWSTLVAAHDRRESSTDMTRICRNIVNGLFQLRLDLLACILNLPEVHDIRVRKLDRLRRQCERSTDLLVGMTAEDSVSFEFAFDPERAKDFNETAVGFDSGLWPNPAEDLVSAGLRLNFIQQLSGAAVDDPEFAVMMQSILATIPHTGTVRNRTLRKSLEWKVATSLC